MNEAKIGISMGEETNKLLGNVLRDLDRSELKELSVDRELADSEGLAGEPITIGAVIGGGTVVLSTVLRLLERHLEHNQQRAMANLVVENFDRDPKLAAELAGLAKKYADVSIKYGIAKEAWLGETKK